MIFLKGMKIVATRKFLVRFLAIFSLYIQKRKFLIANFVRYSSLFHSGKINKQIGPLSQIKRKIMKAGSYKRADMIFSTAINLIFTLIISQDLYS